VTPLTVHTTFHASMDDDDDMPPLLPASAALVTNVSAPAVKLEVKAAAAPSAADDDDDMPQLITAAQLPQYVQCLVCLVVAEWGFDFKAALQCC
jgi:hypothetical protein